MSTHCFSMSFCIPKTIEAVRNATAWGFLLWKEFILKRFFAPVTIKSDFFLTVLFFRGIGYWVPRFLQASGVVLDPCWACLLCSCAQHDWRLAKSHIKKDKGRGKNILKGEETLLKKTLWLEVRWAYNCLEHRSEPFMYEIYATAQTAAKFPTVYSNMP